MVIEFEVFGEPEPKGSFRGIPRFPYAVPDNSRSKVWERAVRLVADLVKPPSPLDCPLRLEVEFTVARPAKPKFPVPAVKPDLDKYLRSTGDAMTGILYVDDSRIVEIVASKKFGATPGALIRLSTVDDMQAALPLPE